MSLSLGRLEPVDLRTVWTSEANHFTPWLAKEENLALLGETLGLELELQDREQSVGPYRADIVCLDTLTEHLVLIENQLERTNHTHLGQLLTYAAGLNAVTIVWIADRFTSEHRAALDWLNEITDETANFFGLEVELWRIGESSVAPKFNVISKPNEWLKVTRRPIQSDLSETRKLQLSFWTSFREYLEERGSSLNPRRAYPSAYMDFAIGRSGFRISAIIKFREKNVGLWIMIHGSDARTYYRLLQQDQEAIESEIGNSLEWSFVPDRLQNYIILRNNDYDPAEQDEWPQQHAWLMKQVELFHQVFGPRIRALDSDDWVEDEEEELEKHA